MRRTPSILWLLPFCFCLALHACGYRFSGSGAAPRGFNRLFINIFENRTAETGIDLLVTDDLKNEFISSYGGQLVDVGAAAAVLSGNISEFRTWTVSRKGALVSLERRMRITVNASLKSASGETIRSVSGVSATETYAVVTEDRRATEENRKDAVRSLSRQVAEAVFHRLTEDF